MTIPSNLPTAHPATYSASSAVSPPSGQGEELREAFTQFVGQTLFGQMLSSMRSTVDKPAYFHGGKTEEIFQQQLDQVLVEDITDASADKIADPMFELFNMRRNG
ncbi:rod-binding protein [Roseimaritima ulvae]|uniref:Flagellar protein FlgJ N-terminal domain-containing protein n=1 Tax=Roseimaritima ulvae TaxID=980254 RepID=A0A5B9R718_9BACT|nr:rod-binding protein [Roseimaritima ulvae]QEG42183.1 hypothetical protein UC8_42170 [Roseimaritima ulvae]